MHPKNKDIFNGIVTVREIERNPFEVSGSDSDKWVQDLLTIAAPKEEISSISQEAWVGRSKLRLSARVEKLGSEIEVRGSFEGQVPAPCSRCGDPFNVERKSDFRVFLIRPSRQNDVSDDPDYVFFDKDQIDLKTIFSEQLIVLEGVAECPPRKADGSCTLCHKNPNFHSVPESGVEDEEILANTPFSKLKGLKLS